MNLDVTWREAVKKAVKKVVERHNDPEFSRQVLIDEEMDYIKELTDSEGKTPEQTLSRNLQELWKEEDFISHEESGIYRLLNLDTVDIQTVDVTEDEVSDDVIGHLIEDNRLVFPHKLDVKETTAKQKVRLGQKKLRELCLENYNHRCAFCEVEEDDLLVAGHIARWSDDKKNRGSLENVISMCRFHDPLFEHGYFTLTEDLEVELHPEWKGYTRPVKMILKRTEVFFEPDGPVPNKTLIMKHRNRCGYEVEEW